MRGWQVGKEGGCRAGMRGKLRHQPRSSVGLEGPSCPSAHL